MEVKNEGAREEREVPTEVLLKDGTVPRCLA